MRPGKVADRGGYVFQTAVDFIGFDTYQLGLNNDFYVKRVRKFLDILCNIAVEKNKLPILSETGFEKIPLENWWTDGLWKTISDFKISYVLIWRNAYGKPDHFYVPYPGHKSANNFKEFYNLPGTLFQNDVTHVNLYKK